MTSSSCARALDPLGTDTEIVRYAEADHGFHCDVREAVPPRAAATDAWARTLAWFDTHLAR